MSASLLKYAYLAYFSQPKSERWLYRHIRRHRSLQIVELGVGDVDRSLRMIQVAQRSAAGQPVHYAGIDLFEARPGQAAAFSLKQAHRLLKPSGALVRLLPGDPLSALASAANTLLGTDLLLISADVDTPSLERAWFYVPRMLHATSLVVRETQAADGQPDLETVPRDEIDRRASAASPRKVASRKAA